MNNQTEFVTIKKASALFSIPARRLHYWLQQGKIDGYHAGQGGYAYQTNFGGRVIYHNLVSISSVSSHVITYALKARRDNLASEIGKVLAGQRERRQPLA